MDSAISSLIESVEAGNPSAADALFAALYSELHRLARVQLSRAAGGLTLGTTTLLHEAYLDLSKRESGRFPDRARFLAYAARAMRSIIVDYARERRAQKRGGEFLLSSLDGDPVDRQTDDTDLSTVNDALEELATIDPDLVSVIDLKFFCGFSFAEIAALKGVSERTIFRQWEKARIYLYDSIGRNP